MALRARRGPPWVLDPASSCRGDSGGYREARRATSRPRAGEPRGHVFPRCVRTADEATAIRKETNGRVAETFVSINQRVEQGQPLFRLDSTAQESAVETARRKIAEIEAAMVTAKSQLAGAEGRIVQSRGALRQANDELERRMDVQGRSPGSIAEADVERMRVQVETA